MKKILYYITDHGHGHASRAIPLINELTKHKIQVTIRNSNSINLLQNSLPKIKIISGLTDVGPEVKNDNYSIDIIKTKNKISKWINDIPKISIKEQKIISRINPDLIISDVSPMPLFAANQTQIQSIIISNYTWYDAYPYLSKKELFKLKNYYDCADLTLQLPFGTKMSHLKNKVKVGLLARTPTASKKIILKKYNLSQNKPKILVALGDLKKYNFNFSPEIEVLALNTQFSRTGFRNISKFYDVQNLVHISDLVLCRLGYGIISECLITGTPYAYTTDIKRLEMKSMHYNLKKHGIDSLISDSKLTKLSIDKNFIQSFSSHKKFTNDVKNISRNILKFIS